MSHNDNQKREAFLRYGLICEMYFGKGMQMKEISAELNCNIVTVSKAISIYLERPMYSISLCSAINDNKSYIRATWNNQTTKQISEALNMYFRKVTGIAMGMDLPPRKETKVKTPIYSTRETTLILNIETGIFYFNVVEAAIANNIPKKTLSDYFKGKGRCNGITKLTQLN